MTLKSFDSYIKNAADFAPLQAILDQRGEPSGFCDIDQAKERSCRLLLIEWKAPGVEVTRGQMILFEHLARMGLTTPLILWGSAGIPSAFQIVGMMDRPAPIDLEGLADLVASWGHWATGCGMPRVADDGQVVTIHAMSPRTWNPPIPLGCAA